MSNSRIIIGIIFSLIFSALLIQSAYATFDKLDFRLVHSPTICALTPPAYNYTFNGYLMTSDYGDKLLQETEYAVIDWKNQLNNGNPVWDMKLIKVPHYQLKTFDTSQCDILINYFPKPDATIDGNEPVGITYTDSTNHNAIIKIFYIKISGVSWVLVPVSSGGL